MFWEEIPHHSGVMSLPLHGPHHDTGGERDGGRQPSRVRTREEENHNSKTLKEREEPMGATTWL